MLSEWFAIRQLFSSFLQVPAHGHKVRTQQENPAPNVAKGDRILAERGRGESETGAVRTVDPKRKIGDGNVLPLDRPP
jgi:hypothetical protein